MCDACEYDYFRLGQLIPLEEVEAAWLQLLKEIEDSDA